MLDFSSLISGQTVEVKPKNFTNRHNDGFFVCKALFVQFTYYSIPSYWRFTCLEKEINHQWMNINDFEVLEIRPHNNTT